MHPCINVMVNDYEPICSLLMLLLLLLLLLLSSLFIIAYILVAEVAIAKILNRRLLESVPDQFFSNVFFLIEMKYSCFIRRRITVGTTAAKTQDPRVGTYRVGHI